MRISDWSSDVCSSDLCVELAGYEADDLIATYARQAKAAGAEVTVVSSDKDLMQLVDGGITMLDPIKERKIGRDEVVEKFGVQPERVVDVQALAGDSTDNVPGVPGIGIKTAAQLITEYGDLETLLARAGEIKQAKRRERLIENAELARISKKLVRLDDDVPVVESIDAFGLRQPVAEDLRAFLERYEFRSLLRRLSDQLGDAPASDAQEAAPESPQEAAYELVQDLEALPRWVAAAQRRGVIAVDTEIGRAHV